MWWVDFVCFFFPDIQLLRLRLLPLKLRLPWRPQDRMYMLVSENQRSQIREITKFRLFTQFSYNWQLYYYTNCSYNATTKILSECFTEKVLLFASFRKYNERSSSSCLNFSPLQSFPLCSWVTKGNRKIVFSVCAKFLLAKLELSPLVLSFVCWFICLCSSILLASTALEIIKTIRGWKYSWIHGRSHLNE